MLEVLRCHKSEGEGSQQALLRALSWDVRTTVKGGNTRVPKHSFSRKSLATPCTVSIPPLYNHCALLCLCVDSTLHRDYKG